MTSEMRFEERIAAGKLLPAFLEFNEFLGTSRYAELEERYRID